VNKVVVKLVGYISDEDELNELESITKVFVVEQRMRNLKLTKVNSCVNNSGYIPSSKKIRFPREQNLKVKPVFTVRGLN